MPNVTNTPPTLDTVITQQTAINTTNSSDSTSNPAAGSSSISAAFSGVSNHNGDTENFQPVNSAKKSLLSCTLFDQSCCIGKNLLEIRSQISAASVYNDNYINKYNNKEIRRLRCEEYYKNVCSIYGEAKKKYEEITKKYAALMLNAFDSTQDAITAATNEMNLAKTAYREAEEALKAETCKKTVLKELTPNRIEEELNLIYDVVKYAQAMEEVPVQILDELLKHYNFTLEKSKILNLQKELYGCSEGACAGFATQFLVSKIFNSKSDKVLDYINLISASANFNSVEENIIPEKDYLLMMAKLKETVVAEQLNELITKQMVPNQLKSSIEDLRLKKSLKNLMAFASEDKSSNKLIFKEEQKIARESYRRAAIFTAIQPMMLLHNDCNQVFSKSYTTIETLVDQGISRSLENIKEIEIDGQKIQFTKADDHKYSAQNFLQMLALTRNFTLESKYIKHNLKPNFLSPVLEDLKSPSKNSYSWIYFEIKHIEQQSETVILYDLHAICAGVELDEINERPNWFYFDPNVGLTENFDNYDQFCCFVTDQLEFCYLPLKEEEHKVYVHNFSIEPVAIDEKLENNIVLIVDKFKEMVDAQEVEGIEQSPLKALSNFITEQQAKPNIDRDKLATVETALREVGAMIVEGEADQANSGKRLESLDLKQLQYELIKLTGNKCQHKTKVSIDEQFLKVDQKLFQLKYRGKVAKKSPEKEALEKRAERQAMIALEAEILSPDLIPKLMKQEPESVINNLALKSSQAKYGLLLNDNFSMKILPGQLLADKNRAKNNKLKSDTNLSDIDMVKADIFENNAKIGLIEIPRHYFNSDDLSIEISKNDQMAACHSTTTFGQKEDKRLAALPLKRPITRL